MANIFGAVAKFLADRFGGVMRELEAETTVGVTAVSVAPRDPERMSLTLANLGTTSIVVAPFASVTLLRGIRLISGGGTVSLNVEEDGHLPSLEWFGIGDAAGGAIYRLEVRRDVMARG